MSQVPAFGGHYAFLPGKLHYLGKATSAHVLRHKLLCRAEQARHTTHLRSDRALRTTPPPPVGTTLAPRCQSSDTETSFSSHEVLCNPHPATLKAFRGLPLEPTPPSKARHFAGRFTMSPVWKPPGPHAPKPRQKAEPYSGAASPTRALGDHSACQRCQTACPRVTAVSEFKQKGPFSSEPDYPLPLLHQTRRGRGLENPSQAAVLRAPPSARRLPDLSLALPLLPRRRPQPSRPCLSCGSRSQQGTDAEAGTLKFPSASQCEGRSENVLGGGTWLEASHAAGRQEARAGFPRQAEAQRHRGRIRCLCPFHGGGGGGVPGKRKDQATKGAKSPPRAGGQGTPQTQLHFLPYTDELPLWERGGPGAPERRSGLASRQWVNTKGESTQLLVVEEAP